MISTGNRFATASDPEGTVNELLTYAALLNNPQLARLYIYAFRDGPVTIEAVKTNLEVPHSTTYKYIRELEEMGILTRHEDEAPPTISVEPLRLNFETAHGDIIATPVLIDAIARQVDSEDIRVFVDRQGIPKLAAAVHYTLRVMDGDLTQRMAANKLGVHPVEGMTVITALQDVIEDAMAYDPHLESTEA